MSPSDKPIEPHLSEIDPYEGVETVDEPLDEAQIGRRATHGIGFLVGQMFGLQALTLGITVVIARKLSVADYGIFAIALAVQQAGHALAELGIGASLISRPEAPTRHEQRAVTGFTLGAAISICALAALVAFVVIPMTGSSTRIAQNAFVASLALPFLAMRTIPTALLERRLRYGRVTALYTADTIAFNLAALAGVFAGWGSFALSAGVPAGALVGLITAYVLQPSARWVTWDLKVIRPLIGFGSQVSVRQGVILARDLTFVSVVAAVGGQASAGYFAMSQRVLGVPMAFSLALGRVGFPAMARSDGDDTRIHNAARSIAVAATAIGLPLALCAGAAEPLLEVLFGSRWTPASEVVIPSAAGLLLMASLGSIVSSLWLSLGNARIPMVSAIVDGVVLCSAAVFFVNWNPTTGIGLAVLTGAVAAISVLLYRAPAGVWNSLPAVARALIVATVAAAAGIAFPAEEGFIGLIGSAASAGIVWLLLTWIFSRSELRLILQLLAKALRRQREEHGSDAEAIA